MKQIIQSYKTGELKMVEMSEPAYKSGMLTVRTAASLVSVGTEKAMIDVAKKSLLGKALARPDWVKQVIDKVKTEGLMEAWRQSKARLDMPVPLGYSSAGKVIKTDVRCQMSDVRSFKVGDRVACTGSGYASHAEIVVVPPNLCARIPDNVSFEEASYGALGGIAMEAVRLAHVEFGHKVVVIGLGLLGQLATQILAAAGCHVFGVDIAQGKCELSKEHGAEAIAVTGQDDVIQAVLDFTEGEGADSVIIFAAVQSNEPIEQAAAMCRERGRIVAGGLVGLDIPRKTFFEKELDFCVSRAWGPGALDPDYEERNVQWPLAYARWTAQRNLSEFLSMLSLGRVKLDKLTTHRFPFDKALDAYELILKGEEPYFGIILDYSKLKEKRIEIGDRISDVGGGQKKEGGIQRTEDGCQKTDVRSQRTVKLKQSQELSANSQQLPGIGLIGAGLFARGTLLPAIKRIKEIRFEGVATSGGLSGKHIADKFKFNYCTTDYHKLLSDPKIDIVFVLTRHNSHAKFVCEALKAGKHVFVEKPLCLTIQELEEIRCQMSEIRGQRADIGYRMSELGPPLLMVGFNRRFSPAAMRAKKFIGSNGPSCVIQIRCNAGFVPKNSWVHHVEEGGGRIIGEVCHFVDLAQFLTGGLPKTVFAACSESSQGTRDNLCVTMQMNNGAAVTITYASNGDKSFPREEVQVFAGGGVFVIHNFKNAERVAGGKRRKWRAFEVDKGYKNELKETLDAVREGKPSPIDFSSIIATTLATFAIEESIRTGRSVDVKISEENS